MVLAVDAADAREQLHQGVERVWLDTSTVALADDLTTLGEHAPEAAVFALIGHAPDRPMLFADGDTLATRLVAVDVAVDVAGDATVARFPVTIVLHDGLLMTISERPVVCLGALREQWENHEHQPRRAQAVLHVLLETVIGAAERLDERADELEDAVLTEVDDRHLAQLTALRRGVRDLRMIARSQRDVLLSEQDTLAEHPVFQFVGGQAVRALVRHAEVGVESVDVAHEAVTTGLALYASGVSNRLGEVGERLTIVATILLPLTVVTGFFGQNFGWMTDRIDTFPAFVVLGIGGVLGTVLALVWWLRRQRVL